MAARARSAWRFSGGLAVLVVAGTVALPAAVDAAIADDRSGRIRSMDSAAARVLMEGRAACATIASLAATLEQSDVIVLLSVTMIQDGLAGDMRFLAATATDRILQIRLDNRRPRIEQMGWLAHELQHAVEVASAPDVRCGRDLALLMARIGRSRDGGHLFETSGAVERGRQAQGELAAVIR
jgi:hypothetical protein